MAWHTTDALQVSICCMLDHLCWAIVIVVSAVGRNCVSFPSVMVIPCQSADIRLCGTDVVLGVAQAMFTCAVNSSFSC